MTSSLRSKPGSIDEGIICPCVPAARALLATVVALGGLVMGRRRVLGGLLLLLVLSAAVWAESQDYYSLLKVNREATTREIRQAFKKLALTMHPDKNPGDSTAHDRFVQVNRAYEVLKDEDLRKKYDKYGEKGLDEQQQGGRYESWNFYRYDFGIYDDDLEIITLDSGDFEAAVNSGEIWFINFYFPRCSHCHELAPTWREFAKEMDGVIRIGAVNCGDNNHLCRSKGINSYPSLYIFRAGQRPEKFNEERSKDSLVRFSMKFITTAVTELWQGNVFSEIESAYASGLGWLITFCCDTGGKDVLYNIVGFARDSVRAHVTTLRPDNFPSDRKEPWLVDFFAPWCPPCRALLPELRKASIQLAGQMKFGTLDCTIHHSLCSTYNIQAYPTTVIFNGSSVHEYEGQHSADGILEFIQDLVNPSVMILDPSSFNEKVKGRAEGQIWAVDFYAPWCGPCQALIPEWRRMARLLSGQILVGSVDCQRFQSFCQGQSVRSYPEIRLYPGNSRQPDRYTSYNGWHRDAHSLRSWALSSLPKASVDLTPESFKSLVLSGQDHWILDFYAPWCGPCQHFAPEFEVVARVLKGKVRAGKVDCQAHHQTCQSAGITAYPTVRFYPYLGTRRVRTGEHINSRDSNVIVDVVTQRLQRLSPRLQNKQKVTV
uniref:DnaJ homolog subfamily C member 10 n=1 Tax=Gasterosteus aculeatus aculeatus TaxID=481459 RepID=A0AAQ4P4Y7_GASAC